MTVQTLISEKYEITQEITRGGFGIVYKGFDRHLGKAVAIKAIDPGLLGEARNIDMFQKEAISVARLNHQNIVQIYDIKRDDNGQLYVIMEYIDGPNLKTLLLACRKSETMLPVHLAAHVIADVCNGIDYAHNRRDKESNEPLNFVHQDISPVNIMLTQSGEVKIIDFGMANLKRQQTGSSREVYIQGKINYMAPEQVNGKMQIDRRTDIFATGLILFELLTGERLIQANEPQQVLEELLAGRWDLSRVQSDGIPERLQDVLKKALQANPKNRYPNANLMYKDLMHYLILTAPATDFTYELSEFIAQVKPEEVTQTSDEPDRPSVTPATEASEFDSDSGNGAQSDSPEAPIVTQEDSAPDDDLRAIQRTQTPPSAPESSPESDPYYSFVEESEIDDQRTIIDVVRLSARTHRKAITLSFLGLIVGMILFTVVDTFAHLTRIGTGIYDFLFPPAIKVVSVPPGAQVFLDDKLLSDVTPLSLNQISPGVHKLMLTLPEYEPIVKSINVPRQGALNVSGEPKRHASQPYILRFKSQFEISSQPSGADIYLDGVKLSQQTPATIFWEVSENPIDIRLEKSGLPSLSGLTINSLEGKEIVDDLRVWKVRRIIAGKAHYSIEGVFHKNVTINSNPSRADIYLNDSDKPVGVTGLNGQLLLPLGTHLITLRKQGYLSKSFSIQVDEDSPGSVSSELFRTVRIFAREVASEENKDLGAKIVDISSGNGSVDYTGRTPAILNLPPYPFTVRLDKEGYNEVVVDVSPSDRTVIAEMEPTLKGVIIVAVDAITSNAIRNVEISFKPERSLEPETVIGRSDNSGQVTGKLAPGFYEVTASKDGYQQQRKSLRVRTDQENRLTFRMTLLR